ncbi:exodeoxyribonuclease V subunit gamma [Escherichia coli]
MEGVGEQTHQLGQPRWHRANLYQRFIESTSGSPPRPAGATFARLYAAFRATAVYLQALQALGKHIEIHLRFTNPCRYYWAILKILLIWRNC